MQETVRLANLAAFRASGHTDFVCLPPGVLVGDSFEIDILALCGCIIFDNYLNH